MIDWFYMLLILRSIAHLFTASFPSKKAPSTWQLPDFFFQKHYFNKETTEIKDCSLAGAQTPYNTLYVQSSLQPVLVGSPLFHVKFLGLWTSAPLQNIPAQAPYAIA